MEVDSLGHLCKILHTYEHGLDIVALHEKIKDLLFLALQFLEDYDCETVGTCISTALYHLWFDSYLFTRRSTDRVQPSRGRGFVCAVHVNKIQGYLHSCE